MGGGSATWAIAHQTLCNGGTAGTPSYTQKMSSYTKSGAECVIEFSSIILSQTFSLLQNCEDSNELT